eukprot:6479209-Amphidinium_carterae.1
MGQSRQEQANSSIGGVDVFSTYQQLPAQQRPSAIPYVHLCQSLSTVVSKQRPDTTSDHFTTPPFNQRPSARCERTADSGHTSPAASVQHQFATPPPTPEASQSPPPPELSRPPRNKGRANHWSSPHELPEQGTVATLVTQYDKLTPTVTHQVGPIPSIPPDDLPPEITGSAESPTGDWQAKSMGVEDDRQLSKRAEWIPQEDKCTMVENNPAANHSATIGQSIKHTQPRMSTPPRYGDAGHKSAHIPDVPVVSLMDKHKPKQVIPVLEVQEQRQKSPIQHLAPQEPSRKRFEIVIRSAAYLEQIRAAGAVHQDSTQDAVMPEIRPQHSSDQTSDLGRHDSEQDVDTTARRLGSVTLESSLPECPTIKNPTGIAQIQTEQQPPTTAESQDTTQPITQPQYTEFAPLKRMLLPSVVAVPPPAHSPRVALQEPYDDPERTRKLLEMAQSALCPPLLPEHLERQRQAQTPVGADPRHVPHVPKRNLRRRAAAQLRDMERKMHPTQEEEVKPTQEEQELEEPSTPIAARPTSDDVLFTPTRSEAEDMCEDLARSLTPSKQDSAIQGATQATISIATLPASQPVTSRSDLEGQQLHPPYAPQNQKADISEQGEDQDIKLPTVTTYPAVTRFKAPPTGIGCRPDTYVKPPGASTRPPVSQLTTKLPQSPPPKAEQIRAGQTDLAIQQAISTQRSACTRYKQPPAGTIPNDLKTEQTSSRPVCKQPPVSSAANRQTATPESNGAPGQKAATLDQVEPEMH